jgi:topoisomerase-4 subunit B
MAPNGWHQHQQVCRRLRQAEVDNFLHKNPDIAEAIIQKDRESEKERKGHGRRHQTGTRKGEKSQPAQPQTARLPHPLQRCQGRPQMDSCIFITEGDSASGSITKSRDVNTQAVFSLRGKPLNSFRSLQESGLRERGVQSAAGCAQHRGRSRRLRYNKVIVATDADVDGMHIRLLMITFFLQFFPELIKKGHVYILADAALPRTQQANED